MCVIWKKKLGGGHNCQNILICNTNYQQFLLYASSGSVGLISTTLQSLKNKLMRQLKEFINFIKYLHVETYCYIKEYKARGAEDPYG